MIEIILLGVCLVLIIICGLFVAAEFSLLAVNRSTVERHAARGDEKAKGVARALGSLSSQLSSAQIGITVTNLAIGFLAEPAIASLLEAPLRSLHVPVSIVPSIAITLGIALATAATMVFGELIPKNIAITKPLGTAKFVQAFQRWFTFVMRYPIRVLNGSANAILARFGVAPQEELASARSADELLSLVRRSAEKGTLSRETAIMMERSLSFGELTALDVMTPRLRMKTVNRAEPLTRVIELAKETGLSRFPVSGSRYDDIVGMIHIKQVLATPREERGRITAGEIMSQSIFIPSSLQLEPLLGQLKQSGTQMAIVIDEFGGTDGIVTIEDLLEELVGEVQDEHDNSHTAIRKLRTDIWLISGLLRPDEIAEELGIFLPEGEEYETIAGLMADTLEHVPRRNESTIVAGVDRDGNQLSVALKVDRMDGRRVDRIRMSVVARPESEAAS